MFTMEANPAVLSRPLLPRRVKREREIEIERECGLAGRRDIFVRRVCGRAAFFDHASRATLSVCIYLLVAYYIFYVVYWERMGRLVFIYSDRLFPGICVYVCNRLFRFFSVINISHFIEITQSLGTSVYHRLFHIIPFVL